LSITFTQNQLPPPGAGAAPTPEPTFVIKSLTLTPSNALAKSPGQYGSTSTAAALRIVCIFSPYQQNHKISIEFKTTCYHTYENLTYSDRYIVISQN
jgi:hypothetical protein